MCYTNPVTYYTGSSSRTQLDRDGNFVMTVGNNDLTYAPAGNLLSKKPTSPADNLKQDYVLTANSKVSKYRGTDGQLLWSTPLDSAFTNRGASARLDAQGNVILLGLYDAPPWYPNHGTTISIEYCVEKYAAQDGHLLWRRTIGSLFKGSVQGVEIDSQGNVVVVGLSTYTMMHIWKVSAADGMLLWSDSFYNSFAEEPSFRASGTYSLRCVFDDSDNPMIVGEVNRQYTVTEYDIYAAKYEASTGVKLWEKLWRARGSNYVTGALIDRQGDVILIQSGSFIRYKAPFIDDQHIRFGGHTEATMQARIRVSDPQATMYVEYGAGSSYGMRTPEAPVPGDGVANVGIRGLVAPNVYHYRWVVQTSEGIILGEKQVFDFSKVYNRAPTAMGDAFVVPKVSGLTEFVIDVVANDSDPDGDPISIVSVSRGPYGTVTTDGSKVTYKPLATPTSDEFSYTIADSYGAQSTATVTVTGYNVPPVAVHDFVSALAHPASTEIWCLSNDSDPEGKPLAISSFTQPTNGSVASIPGGLRYTPQPGFVGEDQFTYKVSDGGLTAQATVRVSVATNKPPVARDDFASVTLPSDSTDIWCLSNDSDPEGKPLTISSFIQPANGSVVSLPSGLRYTPKPGFVGEDQFTYTISDGVLSATATVRVTVGNNLPPIAVDDTAQSGFGGVSINVLANDSDPEGKPLVVSSVTQPLNGSATWSSDGSVLYSPAANFSGQDQFTYTISDGALSATATVQVTVEENLPPIAVDDTAQSGFGGVSINVLANDSDPEGKSLVVSSVTQPLHGSATLSSDGSVRYSPAANFSGQDQFTYTVSDGALSATATVRVTVNARTNSVEPPQVFFHNGRNWNRGTGFYFRRFSVPSVNEPGDVAILAAVSEPLNSRGNAVDAVFAYMSGSTRWGITREGRRAPDASGLPMRGKGGMFRSFKDPLLNDWGDVAFVAKLSKASAQRDTGIWFQPAGGALRMMAREGDVAAGVEGARFGTFISTGLTDTGAIPFVARLRTGKAGVTSANALGLWVITAEGTRLLLRQGDTLSVGGVPKQVKLFAALTAPGNSPGHGHLGTGEEFLVRVTWIDKTQSLIRVSASAETQVLVSSGDLAPGTEAQFAGFGLPSPDKKGGFAVSATLKQGVGGVTDADDVCIYEYTPEAGWALLKREGAGVFLDPERSQPVRNAEGRTAFLSGSPASGGEEVWTAEDGEVYGESPQPSGQQSNRSIVSLAFPGGEHGGAVYVARHTAPSGKKKSSSTSAPL
ncbi:MAG: tandem-95 repeat protein, partial [Verrucomicrobiaceae bacterium]